MTNADKIAALERELVAVKAATPTPTIDTTQAAAKWRDEMHAAAEARANRFVTLSPEKRREMERACSTADLQDLVHASHRPQGPSVGGIPSSQQLTGVHPGGGAAVPGNGTGWRDAAPLGPVAGVNHIDRIAAEFDRRDRVELAERLAKQKIAEAKA